MKEMSWKYYTSYQVYSLIEDGVNEVIKKNGYGAEAADTILNLYDYMINNKWIGACHAISTVVN